MTVTARPAKNITEQGLFLSALASWDPDDVFTASQQIEDLLESPGWEVLQRLLTDARQTLLERMANASVLEQVEYARITGQAFGLAQAKSAAEAVLNKQQALERAAREHDGVE